MEYAGAAMSPLVMFQGWMAHRQPCRAPFSHVCANAGAAGADGACTSSHAAHGHLGEQEQPQEA
eukprot:scaffold250185_cov18-Tisochrysis_lutea.AAC.1